MARRAGIRSKKTTVFLALLGFFGMLLVVVGHVSNLRGALSGLDYRWVLLLMLIVPFAAGVYLWYRVSKRERKKALSFVALTLLIMLLVNALYYWRISGFGYDRTSPEANRDGTVCRVGSYEASSKQISSVTGTKLGDASIYYSPACGTNWVLVTPLPVGVVVEKKISRSTINDWLLVPVPSSAVVSTTDVTMLQSYSEQIWAPGKTCVTASVELKDPRSGKILGLVNGELSSC